MHRDMKSFLDLRKGFMDLVEGTDRNALEGFAKWLDVKMAHFKVYGYFYPNDPEDSKLRKRATFDRTNNGNRSLYPIGNGVDLSQLSYKYGCQIPSKDSSLLIEHDKPSINFQRRNGTLSDINEGSAETPVTTKTKQYHVHHNDIKMKPHINSEQPPNTQGQLIGLDYSKEGFKRSQSTSPQTYFPQLIDDSVVMATPFESFKRAPVSPEHQALTFDNNNKIEQNQNGTGKEVPIAFADGVTIEGQFTPAVSIDIPQGYSMPGIYGHPAHTDDPYIQHMSDSQKLVPNYQKSSGTEKIVPREEINKLDTSINPDLIQTTGSIQKHSTVNARKRGPPKLIAFKDNEPVAPWILNSTTTQFELNATFPHTNGIMTSPIKENGRSDNQHGHALISQQPNNAGREIPDKMEQSPGNYECNRCTISHTYSEADDCGLDLSCKVHIIEPSLNVSDCSFLKQTEFNVKMKNKVYKCQICGKILLNCAGYNRHVKSHFKFNCPNCGEICDGKNQKSHVCPTIPNGHEPTAMTSQISSVKQKFNQIKKENGICDNKRIKSTPKNQDNGFVTGQGTNESKTSSPNFTKEASTDISLQQVSNVILNKTQSQSSPFLHVIDPSIPFQNKFSNEKASPPGVPTSQLADEHDIWGQYLQGLVCPICSRQFLHLSSLNRHLKVHQGVFTHACAVCGRRFTRNEHFLQHKCARRPKNPNRMIDNDQPLSKCAKMVA